MLVVGCGESQQSTTAPETKPAETVTQAAKPEQTTAKARDISIHDAAKGGNIEAVKQHLDDGGDVNLTDNDGMTPLHFAALNGHKEIVKVLIAKGADVNAKDNLSGTSLHFATFAGQNKIAQLEITKLLVSQGADVNAKENNNDWTPLHACMRQLGGANKEVVELLIAKGADVNTKDKHGETPLDRANGEIAELLRKHDGKTSEELKAEGK